MVQSMVLRDGRAKGTSIVLEVNTKNTNAAAMRAILRNIQILMVRKEYIEPYASNQVSLRIMPNRVCLVPRAYANGTITKLRQIVPEGLIGTVFLTIKTVRDYERAYQDSYNGIDVEKQVKI